jgi:hypothetical protein
MCKILLSFSFFVRLEHARTDTGDEKDPNEVVQQTTCSSETEPSNGDKMADGGTSESNE